MKIILKRDSKSVHLLLSLETLVLVQPFYLPIKISNFNVIIHKLSKVNEVLGSQRLTQMI